MYPVLYCHYREPICILLTRRLLLIKKKNSVCREFSSTAAFLRFYCTATFPTKLSFDFSTCAKVYFLTSDIYIRCLLRMPMSFPRAFLFRMWRWHSIFVFEIMTNKCKRDCLKTISNYRESRMQKKQHIYSQ